MFAFCSRKLVSFSLALILVGGLGVLTISPVAAGGSNNMSASVKWNNQCCGQGQNVHLHKHKHVHNHKHVTNKYVSKKYVTKKYVTKKYVTKKNITKKYVTNKNVTNNNVTNKNVTNEHITNEHITNKYFKGTSPEDVARIDRNTKDINTNRQGVALAIALTGAGGLTASERFAVDVSVGAFEDETAVAISAITRLGQVIPGVNLYVHGGVGFTDDSVGGRGSVRVAF